MRVCSCLLAATVLCLPSCMARDGHFSLFGYSTRPNYDPGIRTVYVPTFRNETFYKALEFDLTKAVIREIEEKTPFKVVSSRDDADTELLGKVINLNKSMVINNRLNEIREGQTILAVEIVWRDLRPGFGNGVLSRPGPVRPPDPYAPLPDPTAPPPPAPPILVQSTATYIPELGKSFTAAQTLNIDRLAVQVVSMMEIWDNTIGCFPDGCFP